MAREDAQDQIDVVAQRDGRVVLVGECKWSRRPEDLRDLDGLGAALRKASGDLDPIDRPWRALFARAGFAADLLEHASDPAERVLLYTPADLY